MKRKVSVWIGHEWKRLEFQAEDVILQDNFVVIRVDENNSIAYNNSVIKAVQIGEVFAQVGVP